MKRTGGSLRGRSIPAPALPVRTGVFSFFLVPLPPVRAFAFPGLLLFLFLSVFAGQVCRALDENPDWTKEQAFWSFQVPHRQKLPKVQNPRWPQRPIDYFILARLDALGFVPALEAGKRELIRRVAFDLTGLPPSRLEVDRFLRDTRADAYERLVERLLDLPQFGERMASLWLPLARYAEDQAHQVGNDTKFFYPNAWRYREWIIDAFNRDLPYDQFVALQLAADRLEGTNSPNLAALGFLGLGPKYYNRDRLEVQADEWEDRVDTVTRSLLGLTVACARCHDHKFDPITMQDYYGLAGIFASTRMVNRRDDGTGEKGDIQSTNMTTATLHVVEDNDEPKDLPVFLRGNVDRKGPLVERRFLRVLSQGDPSPIKKGSGRRELAEAIASSENPLTARVLVNRLWGQFFGRPLVRTPSNFGHSGQTPTHPELLDDLAARFVEKGWSVKWLVRELVLSATYRQATRPRFPNADWVNTAERGLDSLTELAGSEQLNTTDPENQWLSHMNRRRLGIEQWRDTVLFLSGELESGGGKSLELDDPANRRRTVYSRISRLKLNDLLMQFDYPDANVHAEKRNLTTTAIQKLFVMNSPFMIERAKALAARLAAQTPGRGRERPGGEQPGDEHAASAPGGTGQPTGGPRAGGEPVPGETVDAPGAEPVEPARVARAYQILFGRDPTREESALALEFLSRPTQSPLSRWEQYAQLLLASNELLYVD